MSGKVSLNRLAVIGTVILSVLVILALVFPITISVSGRSFLSIGVEHFAQANTEVTSLRTETSKTFDLGNGHYRSIISGGALHYKDSQGNWQNINNQIVPAQAPWNYQMTQDTYTARFLSSFTAGQVVKWEAFNQSLAFQPMELQWTNALNQIQAISMPQNTAVLVTNTPKQSIPELQTGYEEGTIRWDDAYGEGRHFWWTCQMGILAKTLELETAPPVPASYIINGGSPVLRLNFIFSPSSGLNIYVDGVLWNKSTRKQTFNAIEFRNAQNQTLWYFSPCRVWDSGGNETTVIIELRKSGNKLYVSARVPYSWLQNAIYPVFIDPSTNIYSSASDGDIWKKSTSSYSGAHDPESGTVSSSKSTTLIGQEYYHDEYSTWWKVFRAYYFFNTSSILSTYTVTTLQLHINCQYDNSNTNFYIRVQQGVTTASPHDPLQASDFDKNDYTGNGGQALSAGVGWYSISVNTSWLVKEGWTKWAVRSSRDIDNNEPSGYEHMDFYTSESSNDPYLYVEYTPACSPSISLNLYSWSVNNGDPVSEGSNYATGLTYFTITNNSGGSVTITIGGTDMTGGGYTWDLSDDGSAGDMVYGMYAGLSGGDYTIVVKESEPYNTLKSGLADDATQDFGLKIYIPTSFDDGNPKTGTVTLIATCD